MVESVELPASLSILPFRNKVLLRSAIIRIRCTSPNRQWTRDVENVKALLEAEVENVKVLLEVEQQQLLYNGRAMRNSEMLSALGVRDEDFIMIVSNAASRIYGCKAFDTCGKEEAATLMELLWHDGDYLATSANMAT
ncbi:receptor-like protein 12 [Pyrus ussuriensis x Pyrus communis]|uniref:Receptor-like protein 12 n=1 Tax=Pyrus ussuriensis x Pyrus communis TaxID=2448454 RepID=A0A5N5I698_9ROSA|nr:receptor-like protein 12 [Pyrus ussuriensis x Pyrus communis]